VVFCCSKYSFIVIVFILYFYYLTNIYFLCILDANRFQPISLKSFRGKIKVAEDTAARLLLPGAHSYGPGEDGEQLPVGGNILQVL
jgi:hypothetical protein